MDINLIEKLAKKIGKVGYLLGVMSTQQNRTYTFTLYQLQSFVDAINARDSEPVAEIGKGAVAFVVTLSDEFKAMPSGKYKLFTSPQPNQSAKQPYPNHNWCVGCDPDNCQGCGTEPQERRKGSTDQPSYIKRLEDALQNSMRELQACQAVIHYAGGFDPAYVNGAKKSLKESKDTLDKCS